MKKIFKIASYDFRRLMFNPITLIVLVVVLIASLIFSVTYKIPTSTDYTAAVSATNTKEIYQNFLESTSSEIDTKSALDELLSKAQEYLDTQTENDSEEFSALTNIKTEFSTIKTQLERYALDKDSSYLNQDSNFDEVESASQSLDEFVTRYKSLDVFESRLFINQEDFEKLEEVNEYIKSTLNNEEYLAVKTSDIYEYIALVLDDFVNNIDLFSAILQTQSSLIEFDPEKIETFQSQYIAKAEEKLEQILLEMEEISVSVTAGSTAYMDEMISLITNYKLTCESAYAGVKYELYLLLINHFDDVEDLYKCEALTQEDLKQSLVKINYFLEDESAYYTTYQEALNFNVATTAEANAYDYTYFILCIIGFFTIIFGIFCAYKLFGVDRRNGKMDVVLSQDVRFGQVFAGKFLAIVFSTSFVLALFTFIVFFWQILFNSVGVSEILAVFNLSTAYTIHPFLFLIIKLIGIELQVVFYSVMTIFIMNLSRKFELNFAISLLIFAVATICNIFLNGALIYCLLPFIHVDLTALLGGGTMSAGFLQTALYAYGNFFISLAYYLVVVVLLYNFTNQLFKKN